MSAVPAGDLSLRGDMLAACKGCRPRWEAASGQWVWALSQGVKLGVDWGSRGPWFSLASCREAPGRAELP